MLVLIYKRSGSKLLFPAVYSEKEMDEKCSWPRPMSLRERVY